MRTRCFNPNFRYYSYYGGRGITVCDRWNDFWLFAEDMGERPNGHTLDRINNEGNYEPSNCRWASKELQKLNKRPENGKFILQVPSGYRVAITIERNSKPHRKTFRTLDEAQAHLEICKLERAVLRQFI